MILPADIEPRSFLGQDAISPSELGTVARCEAAWAYSYNEEREKSEPSAAMRLGSETHRLVQAWHLGADPEDLGSENETAVWLTDRYVRYYQDSSTEVSAVEIPVAAKLPAGPWFFGFADMLVKYEGELWVGEIKTTQQLSNLQYLQRSPQTPLYVWAFRQMGVPVVGVLMDVIRSFRPSRKEMELSESFARDWTRWSDAALVPKVAEAMAAVAIRRQLRDRERVPLRNVGTSCSWCFHQAPCFDLAVEISDDDSF